MIQCTSAALGMLSNRTVASATILDALAVDARSPAGGEAATTRLLLAIVVHIFEIKGMEVTREDAAQETRCQLCLLLPDRKGPLTPKESDRCWSRHRRHSPQRSRRRGEGLGKRSVQPQWYSLCYKEEGDIQKIVIITTRRPEIMMSTSIQSVCAELLALGFLSWVEGWITATPRHSIHKHRRHTPDINNKDRLCFAIVDLKGFEWIEARLSPVFSCWVGEKDIRCLLCQPT